MGYRSERRADVSRANRKLSGEEFATTKVKLKFMVKIVHIPTPLRNLTSNEVLVQARSVHGHGLFVQWENPATKPVGW